MKPLIELGKQAFVNALVEEKCSVYHAEAEIAQEHAIAKDFESTNWKRILSLYKSL